MPSYILVVNQPNRVATVHAVTCSYIQSHPIEGSTSSSERIGFDDGFLALGEAQKAMPQRFGLCSHCLGQYSEIVRPLIRTHAPSN